MLFLYEKKVFYLLLLADVVFSASIFFVFQIIWQQSKLTHQLKKYIVIKLPVYYG